MYSLCSSKYLRLSFIVFLCVWREVLGLSCYSCHYEDVQQLCLDNAVSCEFGEVCINTVYRRPLYNGVSVITSKGCKLRSECQALEALNRDSYCSSTPSECVYCCDSDHCNGALTLSTVYPVALSAILTACLTVFVTHLQ